MAILKWFGIVLGSLLLIIVLLLVLLDWNVVRDYAVRQLSQMTGRRLTITGDLDIDWSLTPRIHTEQIRFENASWSKEPYMLELAVLEFRLDLLALLTGRLVIPELTLTRPRVRLEISSEGKPNWVFRTTPVTEAKAEKGSMFPTIERLWIEDGRVIYRDLSKATDISATITTVHVQGGDDTLNVQAKGKFEGEPISVNAQAGSVPGLRETDKPYPVALQIHTASTAVKVDGTVEQPLQLKGLDLAVDVQGEGRITLLAFAGLSPPHYRLSVYSLTSHGTTTYGA